MICIIAIWGGPADAQLTSHGSVKPSRWLWVKGVHQEGRCSPQRLTFERAFTQQVAELAHVTLAHDERALSCDRASCARARVEASGSVNGLLARSECIRDKLRYSVSVITSDLRREPRPYMKTVEALGASRETLESAARALARRLIRGPRAALQGLTRSERALRRASAGLLVPIQPINHGLGSSFEFGALYPLSHAALRILTSAHVFMSGGDRSSHVLLGGSVGLLYTPHPDRFTPHVGLGLLAGYQWHDHLEREASTLDPQQVLVGAQDELVSGERAALRPWVELGWAWRGGSIEPGLSVRYHIIDLFYEARGPALSVSVGISWRGDSARSPERGDE